MAKSDNINGQPTSDLQSVWSSLQPSARPLIPHITETQQTDVTYTCANLHTVTYIIHSVHYGVCVCVCACVYICIYIYIYIHTHIHICMYVSPDFLCICRLIGHWFRALRTDVSPSSSRVPCPILGVKPTQICKILSALAARQVSSKRR